MRNDILPQRKNPLDDIKTNAAIRLANAQARRETMQLIYLTTKIFAICATTTIALYNAKDLFSLLAKSLGQ